MKTDLNVKIINTMLIHLIYGISCWSLTSSNVAWGAEHGYQTISKHKD